MRQPLRVSVQAILCALGVVILAFAPAAGGETRPVRDPDPARAKAAGAIREVIGSPIMGGGEVIDYFLEKRLPPGMTEYPVEHVRELSRRASLSAEARPGFAVRGDDDPDEPEEPFFIKSWRPLGPGNIGGRTRALVPHPSDASIAYAAAVSGGVFRTDNFNADDPRDVVWYPIMNTVASGLPLFNDNATIAVTTLALDPRNPNILYAGTGEVLVGTTAPDPNFPRGVRGAGVYKGTQIFPGVFVWEALELTPFIFDYISKVTVSPAAPTDEIPKRIYIAATSGIWRHNNGGVLEDDKGATYQWQLVRPDNSLVGATDIQIKPHLGANPPPADEEFLLAAFGGATGPDGLFLSLNGGDNWFRQVAAGVSEDELHKIDTPAQGRMTIAFAPSNPNIVYVAMARNNRVRTTGFGGVPLAALEIPAQAVINIFRANVSEGSLDITTDTNDEITDVQADWAPRLDLSRRLAPALFSNALLSVGCSIIPPGPTMNRGFFSQTIAVDPANPDIVWLGSVDLFRSTDGGRTFGLTSHSYFADRPEAEGHVLPEGQHQIVIPGGDPGTLYVAGNGGIFRTRNRVAAASFTTCHSDLPGGTDILPSTITGVEWESLNNHYESTQFFHGDTGTTRDMFVGGAAGTGVLRSLRRSCTEEWHQIRPGDGGYVQIDPRNNNLFYSTARRFINYFPDRTVQPNPANPLIGRMGRVSRTEFSTAMNPPEFTVSLDTAWTGLLDPEDDSRILGSLEYLDEGLFVTPLHLAEFKDGGVPRAVLWTGGERPWRMFDPEQVDISAAIWEPAGAGLPFAAGRISAIATAPSDPGIVWIGTEGGFIFRTFDGLEPDPELIEWETVWDANQGGFVRAFISSLAIDPDDPEVVYYTNSLFNGTFGFGHIFRRTAFEVDDEDVYVFIPVDGVITDPDGLRLDFIPDIPVHWVSLRACGGEKQLFLATEIGVFASGSATDPDFSEDPDNPNETYLERIRWRYLNGAGLPRTVVESLDFRSDNTIVAFTYGRGAYLGTIDEDFRCETIEDEPCNAADLAQPYGLLDLEDLLAFIQISGVFTFAGPPSGYAHLLDMPPAGETEGCGDNLLDGTDPVNFIMLFLEGCPD